MTAYDEFLYESEAFPESHPARVGAIGKLFGVDCAAVDSCRVLEIGCSAGGNILPMAWALPAAKFLGIDLSKRAIAEAEQAKSLLSLSNVDFLSLDLNEVKVELGEFDYIIAHGVLSWVSPETQQSLLGLCRAHLAPRGLAYLSFNAFPGWHQRLAIREMILMETANILDPVERMKQCRRFMQALEILWKEKPTRDTASLLEHLVMFQSFPDWFLVHDLFGEENHPEYLLRLVRRAETHALQYVGDCDLWKMTPFDLSPDTAALLRDSTTDLVALEQRLDFVRCETFRHAIFCRADCPLQRDTAILRVPELLLSSNLQQISGAGEVPAKFRGRLGAELEISDEILTRALVLLKGSWPRALSFDELTKALQLDPSPENSRTAAVLLQGLFRCLLAGQVVPAIWAPALAHTVGEFPLASSFARLQAKKQGRIVSLLHSTLELDAPARELLLLLDGSRNLQELEAKLQSATAPRQRDMRSLLEIFFSSGLLCQPNYGCFSPPLGD